MTQDRLSLLIDSLASGADVYTASSSKQPQKLDDLETLLGPESH